MASKDILVTTQYTCDHCGGTQEESRDPARYHDPPLYTVIVRQGSRCLLAESQLCVACLDLRRTLKLGGLGDHSGGEDCP